jgi:hypothetical protein
MPATQLIGWGNLFVQGGKLDFIMKPLQLQELFT